MAYNLYAIYRNLELLVASRQATLTSSMITNDQFDKEMNSKNFVVLECVSRKGQDTAIVLTNKDSDFMSRTNDMQKLLKNVKNEIIIFISEKRVTNSLQAYTTANNRKILSYVYQQFTIDMTKAPLVPKHRLMEPEEAEAILKKLYIESKDIAGISVNDTQAIWIGAEIGDCVEITRFSESVGLSITYRRCVSDK